MSRWTRLAGVVAAALLASGCSASGGDARGLGDESPPPVVASAAAGQASAAPSLPATVMTPESASTPAASPSSQSAEPTDAATKVAAVTPSASAPPGIAPSSVSIRPALKERMTPTEPFTVSGMSTAGLTFELADCARVPKGLRFNTATGVVSGTPLSVETVTCTVIATNDDGDAAEASLRIEVPPVSRLLVEVQQPSPTTSAAAGMEMRIPVLISVDPPQQPSPSVSYSVSPKLPPGLQLGRGNAKVVRVGTLADLEISGVPTQEQPPTEYTITARTDIPALEATATVTIAVGPPPPLTFALTAKSVRHLPKLSFSPFWPQGIVDPVRPVARGALDGARLSISPDLPPGLAFNSRLQPSTPASEPFPNLVSGKCDCQGLGSRTYTVTLSNSLGQTVDAPLTIDFR